MRRLSLVLLTAVALVGLAVVANVDAGWLFGRPSRVVCTGDSCSLPARQTPVAVQVPAPAPAMPAIAAPPKAPTVKPPYLPPNGVFPTGVIADKLSAADEKYHQNGQEVSKAVAYHAIGGQGLIDDANKPYVCIVDPDAKRRQDVVATLKRELGDKVKFWDGPPDDWSYATGHKTDGRPTIYAQLADGVVKHRQDDLADGVDAAVGAVRKAFPEYAPAKDPDLRKPPAPTLPGGFDLSNFRNQLAIALAAIVGGLVAFLRGKPPAPA